MDLYKHLKDYFKELRSCGDNSLWNLSIFNEHLRFKCWGEIFHHRLDIQKKDHERIYYFKKYLKKVISSGFNTI